ncbi:hypothetical protein [Cloacibacillus sp. An23]|uniref:hypothetical protein n=1 Tax=Cloacibacillus sp. An23 TaxID=1965591 RepID=UPI000B3AC0B4|nr:hypothetical protein [Cloacibacillus sp. An23]OUO92195.1 hypothetical protein B5F39_11195 [Cloacibacillus sp. An23]
MRRKKLLRVSALIVTLTLLAAGTACSEDTENIRLKPKGYELTEPAYVVPIRDGRDTVELIETQAAELMALREYLVAQNASLEQIEEEFETLEAAVAEERAAWKAETERLAKQNRRLSSPWAVGLFGGYDPFRKEAVCGVGVTYAIIRF